MIAHPDGEPCDHPTQDPNARLGVSTKDVLTINVEAERFDEKVLRTGIVSQDQAIRETVAKGVGEVSTLAPELLRLVAFSDIVEHSDPQGAKQDGYPRGRGRAFVVPEAFVLGAGCQSGPQRRVGICQPVAGKNVDGGYLCRLVQVLASPSISTLTERGIEMGKVPRDHNVAAVAGGEL